MAPERRDQISNEYGMLKAKKPPGSPPAGSPERDRLRVL
jgi:hypothetical protein